MTVYDEMQGQSTKVILSDGAEADVGSETESETIANGAAVSGEIDVRGKLVIVVHMPGAWTAASLGIKAAPSSGGTFQAVYDEDGSLVSKTVAASKTYRFKVAEIFGLRYVKLWSQDGSGNDTNQGAARTLNVDLA